MTFANGRRSLVIIVMNILVREFWNILCGRQTEVTTGGSEEQLNKPMNVRRRARVYPRARRDLYAIRIDAYDY